MSLLTVLKNDCKYFFNKKPIDEFEELKNEIYEKLELWNFDIKKQDITVMLEYTLCVGKFASYTILINGLSYFWVDKLKRIKNYDGWSVSSWSQGLKLGCSSERIEEQTTRATHSFSSVESEK